MDKLMFLWQPENKPNYNHQINTRRVLFKIGINMWTKLTMLSYYYIVFYHRSFKNYLLYVGTIMAFISSLVAEEVLFPLQHLNRLNDARGCAFPVMYNLSMLSNVSVRRVKAEQW